MPSDTMKRILRQIPFLAFLVRVTKNKFDRLQHDRKLFSAYELNVKLAQYVPFSAGTAKDKAHLAMLSAQQIFPLICELQESFVPHSVEIQQIESICTENSSIAQADQLAKLFNKYGSDKSSPHNYQLLYANILAKKRLNQLNILEIGLGTNNTDVVSNMGPGGHPGASLRAFREYLPHSRIYGADIDRRILFQEERIETFFVDQTNRNSFNELSIALKNKKFDLIIDDGLHSPNANIATLIFALSHLKPKGWLVIEDIGENSVPIWKAISSILPSKYSPLLVETKRAFLFVIQNGLVA